jgi:hypothetical protein
MWVTDVLTARKSDNKVVAFKQRVHNLPVAPWLLRYPLGMALSRLLMHAFGW